MKAHPSHTFGTSQCLAFDAIAIALLSWCSIAQADVPPKPKTLLGKETTYITDHLDKEGYVNYEAALNGRLGKGVSPDTNANVLVWKILGRNPENPKGSWSMPDRYFRYLGIAPPGKGEPLFVRLDDYLKEQTKLPESEFDAVYDSQTAGVNQP